MKKVSLSLLILSVIAIVAALYYPEQQQIGGYLISCVVSEDYNGKNAYLIDKNTEECLDSCTVVNGAFKFEGNLASPAVYDVIVNRIKGVRATVIVENGTKAHVDLSVRPTIVADNGGYNQQYAALNANAKEANKAINAKMMQLQDAGKTPEEIDSILQPDWDALYSTYHKVIDENKENIFGAYFLAIVARDLYTTCAELDSVIAKVKYSAELGPLVDLRSSLYYREKTQPGNMFIDFTAFASDGSVARFSEYIGKGKYVLVDFWASWCGPCRDELPNFIAISQKYTNDKFMLLGVNICDFEANFKEAMATIPFGYPQMFVPRDNKDNVVRMYNVGTMPHTIIFAPDGTIVARGMLGEELVETVESLLNNVN